jgi:hypothetical protein
MSQPIEKNKYEELNDFPEKVTLGVDDPEAPLSEEDVIDLSAELEEILFLEEEPARMSDPIVDENPSLKTAAKEPVEETDLFDIESLASEIDSLGQVSVKAVKPAPDDFNEIIEAEDMAAIEDLTILYDVVKDSSESELMLEPVSELSTGDDRAFLIQEKEALSDKAPLWIESDDFRITEVEGFDGVRPDALIDFLHTGKREIEPVQKKAEPAAVAPEPKEPDEQKITTPETQRHTRIEVATPRSRLDDSVFGDLYIPFIEIEEDDSSDSEILSQPKTASEKADDEIEMVVLGSEPEISSTPEFVNEVIEPKQVKIPESFSLKPMDLNEAERIAREEIVIIDENDLIEELESMDLLPVSEYEPVKERADSEVHFEYVTPAESAIDESHRRKIEGEVESDPALIIEEDVNEIRNKLESAAIASYGDDVIDITDRVVIIEDAGDMERFVASIPEAKREDMKRLLHYLDGLFEKLPEDVVKRFADSEYFDLYVKIMNELEA